MDRNALAASQYGLITWRQLIASGLSPNGISRLVRSRHFVAVHRAVYAIAGAPRTFEQTALAAQLAGDAALSHLAAARLWRIESVTTDRAALLIPHERRLTIPGVDVYRSSHLDAGDFVRRGPFRLTSPRRTMIDIASSLDVVHLEHALDDALRRGLVSVAGITKRLSRIDRTSGGKALRRLVAARDGRRPAGSTLQTIFRRALKGLPAPIEEFEIYGRDGSFIARVDMAYPSQRIAIEIDGWKYHSGRSRWELDAVRQNRLVLEGWTPLRFTSADLPTFRETLRGVLLPENGSRTPRNRNVRT